MARAAVRERMAYSITEAAELSGRSARTLREKCQRGDIGFRDGGKWFITNVELHALCRTPLSDHAHEPDERDHDREDRIREARRLYAELGRVLADLE